MNRQRLATVVLFVLISLLNVSGQIAGRPASTPTPSPTPTPVAAATPARIATLDELLAKIRLRIAAPEALRARIGIKIVTLNGGKTIFENDADKYFMPASNMKNFTVSTALERLGPDFKFRTCVFANTLPDAGGKLKGPLVIRGGGDVSMSNAFDPAFPKTINPYWAIDRLVERIAVAGIKRIEGDLIGDETYFSGYSIPESWEWDDLQTYSGAEVSPLPLNDNVVDLNVSAGSVNGPCIATLSPANQIIRLINTCTTGAAGSSRQLRVFKWLDQNTIEISGSLPVGRKEDPRSITVTRPASLFVDVLKQRLASRGIVVTGAARAQRPAELVGCKTCQPPPSTLITTLESPPLSVIAARTMKPSQNMYTETLLWTLGEEIGRKGGATGESARLGLSVVKSFLGQIGIPDDAVVQHDGSGLSRHDLITPNAVVRLYTYMAKESRNAAVWRDSLTIGGVDGTLANRFKGTAAEGNMRGKTGTIDQVSALSGYVTTAAGEQLVVSFIINGIAIDKPGMTATRQRTSLIDDIVVYLANFSGRLD